MKGRENLWQYLKKLVRTSLINGRTGQNLEQMWQVDEYPGGMKDLFHKATSQHIFKKIK